MPKYIANGYLVHKGVMVRPGKELELTFEQAKHLDNKVKPKKETTAEKEKK